MLSRTRILLLAVVAALLMSTPALADVIHGYAWFEFGSWDFSDSLLVGEYDGDLSIVYVVDPPLGYVYGCWNGASARTVSGSFEDVLEAPADLSTYETHGLALLGPVYVLRTAEGHYVKYHMIQVLPAPLIEYVYQPDGSRILVDILPVQNTTWGAVKALYR
ncbi:MAG: hypothetical protein OEX18_15645 [Candidatus Krumholzibacteria bacterium]|nr:hypothetical protein [Candidatus Krumholzibacteria bacterium]MDH4338696.1 hypothetical protein [Candidatus Krumholzibacteria bacterium]MDH5271389.1 hypothetical protein [Candidatus Krumholzibacteria bacterium]